MPTTESPAWDNIGAEPATALAWDTPAAVEQGAWGSQAHTDSSAPATTTSEVTKTPQPSESTADSSAKKTWASMFAKPKPPPVPVVPKQPTQATAPTAAPESSSAPADPTVQQEPSATTSQDVVPEHTQQSESDVAPTAVEDKSAEFEQPETTPYEDSPAAAASPEPSELNNNNNEAGLTSSHDPLTEDNLEHLPDSSIKPATQTVASTVGSTDPRVATPATSQQAPIGRPPMGGYAASAYRAAGTPGRNSSYQRRVLEQQEAVVMPGHNAVDRAAVQFGSMGLNGEPDSLDVDEEREEPETRTQPPQQSPPSQPRASLPPAPRQLSQEPSVHDNMPAPKQAPGLPPVPQQAYGGHQEPSHLGSMHHEASQSHGYGQYGRYAQQSEQKSFDPFSHQAPSSAYDHYAPQSSAQQQQQQQQHQPFGGFSSAPSDYSHYYTADQQRNAYQSYYGNSYGQQTSQDSSANQQRSASGFGSAPNESPYSASQAPQQVSHVASSYPQHDPQALAQSRYGEAPGSGQNTPAPSSTSQAPAAAAPTAAMHQQYNSAYPYGHPHYQSPYHAAYQNQFGFTQPAYGSPFGGKGAMYGQPHGYGMNSASTYDHSASPANAGGFGAQPPSMQSRDSGINSGIADYGRASAQPQNLGSGFAGMSDAFGRSQSGYQGQSQGYGQQQSGGPGDDLKPFGESKASGPSPSLGQPGRPSSAANSVGGQTPSTTLPPPQSHQAGFGGYPGFNSQYGLGGLGGQSHQQQQQQQQQQGGYGGYGSGFGNSYYGRGGWGGNYGGH